MEISGYWNIYKCNDCNTDFAISQESDDVEEVSCPHCGDWNPVTDEYVDFIER